MHTEQVKGQKYSPENFFSANRRAQILFVTILVLAVFFRFVNLDKKPIWADETHTFSVISGYSESELIDKFSGSNPVSAKDFLALQYPNPDKNLGDSFYELYTDVHPPLYFLIARSFVQWFGNSVKALRSASAVLSLLTLPCIYWLCTELFRSPAVGSMALVLFCVSPFQVIYAQEARPYSLFTLVILFSGASLLWALRTQKWVPWLVFSLSIAAGLYSQFFFLLVIFGYSAYVIAVESFRITPVLRRFFLSVFSGFVLFSPWLITVLIHSSNFKEKSSWIVDHTLSIPGAVRLWSENISLSFVDPRASEYFGFGRFGLYFLIPIILAVVIYSLWSICVKTPRQTYLFLFTLIGSTALPLIAADLILGGNRQIWPRYLIPCFLGCQISVAYLLANKIGFSEPCQKGGQRRLWVAGTVTLVTAGIFFCAVISQADVWWNKYEGGVVNALTRTVNQAEAPLVMVNRLRTNSPLYYGLEPDVELLFLADEEVDIGRLQIDRDVFLLNPSSTLKSKLRNSPFDIELLFQSPYSGPGTGEPTELWKLSRN